MSSTVVNVVQTRSHSLPLDPSQQGENLNEDEEFELPETDFMNFLRESLHEEQFLQLIKDIKDLLKNEKNGFCETNYGTTEEAQLLALLIKIMMTETGFVVDQSLEECKRKAQDLKKEKEYIERQEKVINAKKSEKDQLVEV